ncbi:hypothetical protein [Comamonas sp. 23]|uniref:hypothetical protein n=1 Tax=Comamonas sp. 23 TaxID=3415008 RepID=UPI003C705575
MAKPNYQYEKRQRELEKKKKKEEKALRKASGHASDTPDGADGADGDAPEQEPATGADSSGAPAQDKPAD